MALADQDESVRIAVRALGDMRNSTQHTTSPATSFQTTPALSITSASSSPSLPSPSLIEEELRDDDHDGRRRAVAAATVAASSSPSSASPRGESEEWKTLSRVQSIPLVTSALRAYEQSKASSRVVKYGAEMMESSVKTISRPVIDRLPVGQLDEFASRQLDRLYTADIKYRPLAKRFRRQPRAQETLGIKRCINDKESVQGELVERG